MGSLVGSFLYGILIYHTVAAPPVADTRPIRAPAPQDGTDHSKVKQRTFMACREQGPSSNTR